MGEFLFSVVHYLSLVNVPFCLKIGTAMS